MYRSRVVPASLQILTVLAILTATAFPALAQDAPPNLTTWSDLNGAVATAYAGIANAAVLYPPGAYHFIIDQGYFTFTDSGEAAVLTSLCTCSTQFNVMVWQMTVVETQLTTRVWLYEDTGGEAFYTNQNAASYNPTQWVQNAYQHDAPGYLTGADLDQWYIDRDRSRFYLTMTFVDQHDWPTMQAAMQVATTNNPTPGTPPTLPGDTNNMSISNIRMSTPGALDLWVYTPNSRPVALLMSTNLMAKNWTVAGGFGSTPPFNLWHAPSGANTIGFFMAGPTDVDSDGDGIPDFIETYVLGTDPNCFDTTGSFLGDYYRVMIYGLDPLSASTVGDGIPDAWKIANGINPLDPAVSNEDPDGDGLNNLTEYLLGTSPNIPSTLDAANTATLRTASPLNR